MVYVSHATDEVTRLADTLLLLEQGRVTACGPLQVVMSQSGPPVRLGGEVASWVQGEVAGHDAGWHLTEVRCGGGSFWLPDIGLLVGRRVRLRVLARDVSIATQRPRDVSIQNVLLCTILELLPDQHPAQSLVRLDCAGTLLWARLTRRAVDQLGLHTGQAVWAQVKAMSLVA
jgi:molybdate transport system ATP-binding protein